MARKLVIPCGDYNIVAEIDSLNLPEIPPELRVYLTNNSGMIIQDICLVRQQCEYGAMGEPFVPIGDAVTCLVWGDENDEDFTHDFGINVYKEEE